MDAVLAVLLRPVEGAVREANQLTAIRRLARKRGDTRRDRDRADVLEPEPGDPLDDRGSRVDRFALVVAGEQERELVAAQAERLAVLAQRGRHPREHSVAGRVAE